MKIMVSACLMGQNCKYNGEDNYSEKVARFILDTAEDFKERFGSTPMRPEDNPDCVKVIRVCPEVEGGLPVPRPSCEMVNGKIMNTEGECKDEEFRRGAEICLEVAMREKPDIIILQSRSPSCGVNQIYDGTFSGKLIKGSGVFATMLKEHGFKVVDVEDL